MNNIQDFQEHPANNAQSIRQLAHSFVYNQGILFDQREADRQQQLEQDYRLGLEERRREQWESYRKTFDELRSQAALDTQTLDVLDKIEREVSTRLSGEQAKDAELFKERQSAIDKKRLEMARSAEEQIPLDSRPLINSVSNEVEANPTKFDASMTWAEHVAYFNAKWKSEGFTVAEPYEMMVGSPPMKISVPGGQVAHAVSPHNQLSGKDSSVLTREGLIHESNLARLISDHPEQMGNVLLSSHDFGPAQSFADGMREIWKNYSPDKARDSILMLCSNTLEFHSDFGLLISGQTKIDVREQKAGVRVLEATGDDRKIDGRQSRLKRKSVLDELEQEVSILTRETKKEKSIDF